jgi:hypothetical protein
MLQTRGPIGRDTHGPTATPASLKATIRHAVIRPERDDSLAAALPTRPERDDGLVAAAGPIMIAAYSAVLAVAVLAFKGNGEALLAVAVSIAFAIVFFGVPLAMIRTRSLRDARWQKAAGRNADTVDTYTGRVDRTEAVVHMVIVPVVVSIAFACFAAIWVLVRP